MRLATILATCVVAAVWSAAPLAAQEASEAPAGPYLPRPETLANDLSEIPDCDDPVIMVVLGEVSDRGWAPTPGEQRYGEQLRERNLYDRFGGHYIYSGPPMEMFEGDYPDNRMMLAAEFPCREAARHWYYSDDYQEIIPLRRYAGQFWLGIWDKRTPDEMNRRPVND